MRRLNISVNLAMYISMALMGCNSGPVAPSAATVAGTSANTTRTIQVGLLPATDFLGFYVAIENGYFEEQGLKPEVRIMAGGAEIMPALLGGSLDIGITNTFSHVLAADNGFDLKMITPGSIESRAKPMHALFVGADSPIRTAKDIEGKNLAVNTLNNIDHVLLQDWLEHNGADPAKVRFVEIPFPQQPAALAQGKIDVSAVSAPFTTIEQSQGARLIAHHYVDVVDRTMGAYFVAANDWLQNNSDVAKRFAAAVARGTEFGLRDEAAARRILAKHLKLEPGLAEQVTIPELPSRVDPSLIQWWIDAGVRRGLIKTAVDPQRMIWDTAR